MKTFVSVTRAFAAFSVIFLITSVIAQTSAVVAQTQEDAPPLPPRPNTVGGSKKLRLASAPLPALLPLMVEFVTVREPVFRIPPPSPPLPNVAGEDKPTEPLPALLPLIVLLVMVRKLLLSMPPPDPPSLPVRGALEPLWLPLTVTPESVSVP